MPPLASASEAKLLRKATGSLTPLVSALGTELSAAMFDVQEVIGDVKIVTTSGSEPAPVELKNHPTTVNVKTLASEEFDGRPTLTYQTIDRFEAPASMKVVSARGGVSDDIKLVELADVEAATSERQDKEWKSV